MEKKIGISSVYIIYIHIVISYGYSRDITPIILENHLAKNMDGQLDGSWDHVFVGLLGPCLFLWATTEGSSKDISAASIGTSCLLCLCPGDDAVSCLEQTFHAVSSFPSGPTSFHRTSCIHFPLHWNLLRWTQQFRKRAPI